LSRISPDVFSKTIRAEEEVEGDLRPADRSGTGKRLIQGPLIQLDDDFMYLVSKAVCEVMGMEV